MRTKIYLASRYGRREELCGYREQLRELGCEVTSRWLNGNHQIDNMGKPIGDKGEALIEGDAACATSGEDTAAAAQLRAQFALEDIQDVYRAETLIAFTEPPRSSASRGGRHVELGYALAKGSKVIVVGYRENIFCWLPDVEFFETWDKALEFLKAEFERQPNLIEP